MARSRADLRASFVENGNGHTFVLRNVGAAPARNVRVTGLEGGPELESLIASRVREVFPMSELLPSESINVDAEIGLSTLPVPLIISWDDDDGSDHHRQLNVRIAEEGVAARAH
jgi:hypothetical protein